MGQNTLEKIKTIEVFITALRITPEEDWLRDWIKKWGDSVERSPHYHYLLGVAEPMNEWMDSLKMPKDYLTFKMMEVLRSLIKDGGQKEPILIYEDMRINSGHKRAACLLFIGADKIKAKIVPMDYKF